ncbi:hypothetical protein [Candidatus Accumulibacter sp. ACC003]|uniref:hypothetical protein n=1 Tax=Candidatus Accumulibacter sp. ACC003 TaxID=2823334 RepID=UPI0025BEB0E4|nr:hypothetical protein [Candidatus Accumulibacter sp. ACC003]
MNEKMLQGSDHRVLRATARQSAARPTSDFLIPAGNVGRIPELHVALYFDGHDFLMA